MAHVSWSRHQDPLRESSSGSRGGSKSKAWAPGGGGYFTALRTKMRAVKGLLEFHEVTLEGGIL